MKSSHSIEASTMTPPSPRTAGHSVVAFVWSAVLTALMFGIGLLVTTPAMARWDLGVDKDIASHERTQALTGIARVLTASATPTVVGIGAIILLPLFLLLRGRRWDAVRIMFLIGAALALAEVAKTVIGESRPPVWLWAIPADSGTAYPSGHTTVAAVIVLAVMLIVPRGPWRPAVITFGTIYVLGVAASRVYLANHYPLDVVGSVLAVFAASALVRGLVALPAVSARARV